MRPGAKRLCTARKVSSLIAIPPAISGNWEGERYQLLQCPMHAIISCWISRSRSSLRYGRYWPFGASEIPHTKRLVPGQRPARWGQRASIFILYYIRTIVAVGTANASLVSMPAGAKALSGATRLARQPLLIFSKRSLRVRSGSWPMGSKDKALY